MNNGLLILAIIIIFSLMLLVKKLFGKYGLIAWVGVASILAQIATTKSVNVLGLSATLGNVLFASNFLATDMLTENYGKKSAKKAVYIGIFFVVFFILISQLILLFVPNELDFANESLQTIFGLTPRISIASLVMLFIANMVDVWLYDKLKTKFKGEKMWLRNNISTIVCNGLENFAFDFLAFAGIFPISDILIIALSTTLIEVVIALCDTPFLYLSKKIKCKSDEEVAE